MKRIIALMLVLILMLCGCGSSSNAEVSTDPTEAKPQYRTNVSGQKEWTVDNFPFEMDFGGTPAKLHDIKFYELYANHGFTFVIFMSIDRSNLTDDDIYWITKPGATLHKDLDVVAYNIKFNGSSVDTNRLNCFGGIYDEQYIYYAFSSDLQRESFLGEKFSCSVYYTPESITNPDGSIYSYFFEFTEDNYSDSSSVLTEYEQKVLLEILK